jgi:hypothetical protein
MTDRLVVCFPEPGWHRHLLDRRQRPDPADPSAATATRPSCRDCATSAPPAMTRSIERLITAALLRARTVTGHQAEGTLVEEQGED